MSYKKCVEKYQKHFPDDDDSGEGDIPDETKKGAIRKKPERKTSEIREVALLNPDIKSASKISGIAERVQGKRKCRHDKLMKKLAKDLNEVNIRVEENVRLSSEEVKAQMKIYKDCLQDKLKSLDTPQVASYHESVFLDIQKEANVMKSHQLQVIGELYDELIKFESSRLTEYERIFHSSFQEIEKTAYFLPYEVQSFIEHEALKMNQLTLNNRRCYEDLKLKLVLVTEQTFKSFIDEVFCLKEKWIRYQMQEAFDQRYSRYEENRKAVVVKPKPQTRLELKTRQLAVELTLDGCFSIAKAEEWFRNVNVVRKTLGNTKNVLIELYQQVVKAAEKDLRSDCDELRKSLLSFERLQFEERSIQPIVFKSDCVAEENMDALERYWQNTLEDIKLKLEDSFDLLTDFGELWNRHVGRLCESKILVLRAVERAEENGVAPLQELEVKVNLSLDALRQEYNEGKLETLYAGAVANLDAIKERLESDYINEVTITEDYYKMMNLEADVLSSEIKEFVYLKLSEGRVESEGKDETESEEVGANGLELRKQIDSLFSEMEAFKVWKSKLRETLENLAEDTRGRLAWRAEDWVTNKIQEISRKYQTQLEMHHKRYDRIRSQIYDVRLEEICVHQRVFDEHKAGVEEVYRKLTRTTENFYEKSTEKLERCRSRVTSVVAEAKKEDRGGSLKSVQTQMQREKSEFMTEVAMKAEQCRQEIEFRVTSVQQSNIKFMKSIKLFHENGNYDAEEAKSYITSLENIDKESSGEGKAAIRETRKKETEILQKASEVFDEALRTLMQLDDELHFYGNVRSVVNFCKSDLRELSAALKEDFDLLNKHVDFMEAYIADETSFLSQDGHGLWFLLIALLYRNIFNLFYTFQVPEWLENAMEETNENVEEKKAQVPKPNKGKDSKPDYPCKDFREDIFDPSLLTYDSPAFMTLVFKKCWDHMDNLQRTGYVFYKTMGSKTLIREDLLKSNYDEFGTDTCRLFRSFALQCETVWLHTIRGFLPVLGDVKSLLKTYFERRVREYAEKVASSLNDYDTEFTNSFNANSCRLLRELQSLDNKLLPLHGYPRNSHLLKSLEDEVVEKIAELELSWEVFINGYQNKMKSIRKLSTIENEECQILKALYTDCRGAVFVENLDAGLLQFIHKIIDNRGYVKKIGKTCSKTADKEGLLPDVVATPKSPRADKPSENHKLKLHHLQGGLEDSDAYFAEIKRIIRRESVDVPIESDADTEDRLDLSEPKLGLLTRAEDFEEMIEPAMKRIRTIYREIKAFLRSKKNFHKEVVFDWLDRWKGNLEKNGALFTVRYPEAEDPSDKYQRGQR